MIAAYPDLRIKGAVQDGKGKEMQCAKASIWPKAIC